MWRSFWSYITQYQTHSCIKGEQVFWLSVIKVWTEIHVLKWSQFFAYRCDFWVHIFMFWSHSRLNQGGMIVSSNMKTGSNAQFLVCYPLDSTLTEPQHVDVEPIMVKMSSKVSKQIFQGILIQKQNQNIWITSWKRDIILSDVITAMYACQQVGW